ncbi:MAG: hypothetical protein L6U99_12755 [Clostridium sp.]|nr:MAG: hypothetical protein L6U99_12755 [Clostridium sp.]
MDLAKSDIKQASRDVTKYEFGLAINLVLNIFLLIASLNILDLQIRLDTNKIKYIFANYTY